MGSSRSHQQANEFGGYQRLLDYSALAQIEQRPTVYVDFSGDVGVRDRLAEHLGEALLRVVSIGMTHWQNGAMGKPRGSYASEVFFAPGWAAERGRSDPRFPARMFAGWQQLLGHASQHFPVLQQEGIEAISEHFAALVAGCAESGPIHTFRF